MKNRLLAVAAVGEAVTGLVLLVYPPIVVRLLFGAELSGSRQSSISRVARHRLDRIGCRLLALRVGIPRTLRDVDLQRACHGLSSLSRFRRRMDRPLLWPAVVLHAVLTLLLARAWCKTRKDTLT